jgi:Large polyvalent protein-associated domain 7
MYYLHIGDKTERYTSPKEAGKAFYLASIDKKPSITIKEGSKVITLADTVTGKQQDDSEHSIKRLRTSATNEKGFSDGYFGELSSSLNMRLKTIDWAAVKAKNPEQAPNLDRRIYDDIEALAKSDPKKAVIIWKEHAPEDYPRPAIVDNKWITDKEELGEISKAFKDAEISPLIQEESKDRAGWDNSIERNEARQQQDEKDRLSAKADAKRIEVEELTDEAKIQDQENKGAERFNQQTNWQKQVETEKEKERQIGLMEQVNKQFHSAGNEFRYKDQRGVAFKEKGSKLVTQTNDQRVARAMATVAAAKGWKTIRVSGHPDFQREVWLAGSLHGIEVNGYTPTERDQKQAEKQLARSLKNQVTHDKGSREAQKSDIAGNTANDSADHRDRASEGRKGLHTGMLVSHGEAPYNNDPNEKNSYFVTLATDSGRKTIWGKDLKRSFENNQSVKAGDKLTLKYQGKKPVEVDANVKDDKGAVVGKQVIQAHLNNWEVTTEKGRVLQAVGELAVQKRYDDPNQQNAAMDKLNKEISRREQIGKLPTVEQYDDKAPVRSVRHEIASEKQADMERTR